MADVGLIDRNATAIADTLFATVDDAALIDPLFAPLSADLLFAIVDSAPYQNFQPTITSANSFVNITYGLRPNGIGLSLVVTTPNGKNDPNALFTYYY
jgi:hypothetical protein